RDFLAFTGTRAEAISPGDITAFRNKLREEGRSVATCNAIRGMLSVPFGVAHKLGFIPINPVSAVEFLKDRGTKPGRSHLRRRKWRCWLNARRAIGVELSYLELLQG